jgi:hypothetical protein
MTKISKYITRCFIPCLLSLGCDADERFEVLDEETDRIGYVASSPAEMQDDRSAELPESLLEQGWYVDNYGELVREREDGTLEHALPRPHDGINELTASIDPSAVIYGVWTPLFSTESCKDLFGQLCTASVPNQQCNAGDACEWYPGASCFDVISSTSVKVLRCKK